MRTSVKWSVLTALLLVGVTGSTAIAQGKSQEKMREKSMEKMQEKTPGKTQAKSQAESQAKSQARSQARSQAEVSVVFRSGDRERFQDYFASHKMKAKPLPPGMAKRLAKGKPLPPGIAKQVMPPDLLRIAPPLPKDAEYGIVGDAVVVTKAGMVIDILAAVLK